MNKRNEILGFSKSMLFQCIFLYICIWGGLVVHSYVFFVIAGCTVLTAMFYKTCNTYYQLFFLLSFSVIFKLSPEAVSLFTYLMIVCGVILLWRKKNVHIVTFALMMVFIIYAIFGMRDSYTTVAKIVTGFILLYVFVTSVKPDDFKNHIMAFSLGILGSSIIGLMRDTWDRIAEFYTYVQYVYQNGEEVMRFSGLNYDPNYHSVAVIIALFLCLRLFFNKEGNKIFLMGVIVSLCFFGFISYSKMFLLLITLLGLVFVFCKMKTRKQFFTTIVFIACIILLFYRRVASSDYISVMIGRITDGDVSTGRFGIWQGYIEYIVNSPKTLFFGDGLGSPQYKGSGSHNAYIELIYYLGIVGGSLFVLLITNIMGKKKYVEHRNTIDRALFLLFFVMIGTLGFLTVNDLMFYCMLLWISMNLSRKRQLENSDDLMR